MGENQVRGVKSVFSVGTGLVSLAALVFAVGCSKMNQDPMANQPADVRAGKPPEEKTGNQEQPQSEEVLKIDTPDFASFKEGTEGELKISGRVLQSVDGREPEYGRDFTITVGNLKDFPGATYDEATGTFKWMPPRHFVDESSTRNMQLELMLATNFGTRSSRQARLPVFVSRTEFEPEIVRVDDLTLVPIREGEARKFKVVVKDPDAKNVANLRPRLFAVAGSGSGSKGIAHLVQPSNYNADPTQDPNDPSNWIFEMALDTTNKELTKKEEKFSFSLVAVSRFGRSSVPKSVDAVIRTSVREPQVSWSLDPVEVMAGMETTIRFSVYDPMGEAKLDIDMGDCRTRLPGASCSCTDQAIDVTQQLCTISWKVPKTMPVGLVTFTPKFTMRSQVPGDAEFKRGSFQRNIRVLPAVEIDPELGSSQKVGGVK